MKHVSLTPDKYLLPHEESQLVALLDKFKHSALRNTTMLLMMLRTGCRPTELLNLRWEDISLTDGTIYVRTLKGGPSRVIPISAELMSRLSLLHTRLGCSDGPFGVSYNQFCRIWHEYRPVKKKLHSLRHTFAVNAYKRSGHDLRLVQSALGHSSLQTTAIYLEIHSNLDEMRKVLT